MIGLKKNGPNESVKQKTVVDWLGQVSRISWHVVVKLLRMAVWESSKN